MAPHEVGRFNNVCINYTTLLRQQFEKLPDCSDLFYVMFSNNFNRSNISLRLLRMTEYIPSVIQCKTKNRGHDYLDHFRKKSSYEHLS